MCFKSPEREGKQRDFNKHSRVPVKIESIENKERPRLPRWLYTPLPKASEGSEINRIKKMLREKKLYSVCEEASCPNLAECKLRFSCKSSTSKIRWSLGWYI